MPIAVWPKVAKSFPKVAQQVATAYLHLKSEVCHKHNSFPLGEMEPSFPSTKELYGGSLTF